LVAYLMADVEVTDPTGYQEYRNRFDAILRAHEGRLLVNGGPCEALEGVWLPKRLVVLEFPSADHARNWYTSPEYRDITPIRARNAVTHFLTLVEGAKD
jgi:uncharacterized protein (DUF1330 family)